MVSTGPPSARSTKVSLPCVCVCVCVCLMYPHIAAASSLCYHHSSMKLFVGLSNGTIHVMFTLCDTCMYSLTLLQEYKLSRDLNRLDPKRTYLGKPLLPHLTAPHPCMTPSPYCPLVAHAGRVTGLHCVDEQDWLLSVSRDKSFQWYCTKTGRKLGSFEAHAWCLAVQYPPFIIHS